jgi:hypothetical protein
VRIGNASQGTLSRPSTAIRATAEKKTPSRTHAKVA